MAQNFIFFDVANTLLHKPKVYSGIHKIISRYSPTINLNAIKTNHKLLSEVIKFPDKTNREFYDYFNTELLLSLGILPSETLLSEIFSACTYQEWEKFEDCDALEKLTADLGIISNWDSSLPEKLKKYFSVNFNPILCSQQIGVCKPDIKIFEAALNSLNKKYDSIYYVGDSIKLDMIPSNKAGFKNILIDRDNIFPYYTGEKISNLNQLENFL